jgi:hypothetical protein
VSPSSAKRAPGQVRARLGRVHGRSGVGARIGGMSVSGVRRLLVVVCVVTGRTHRICQKQVLGGLTREYQIAA